MNRNQQSLYSDLLFTLLLEEVGSTTRYKNNLTKCNIYNLEIYVQIFTEVEVNIHRFHRH